jgi:dethiobiotin synthetase
MAGDRPARLAVVVGTGTEVGKTWVAAAALAALRAQGRSVAARKPAQSFEPDDTETDADVLAAATGERPTDVCPPHRWYEVALAPPMAAAQLGRPPFTLRDLDDEITWPPGIDVGLVETAGGVRSPLSSDDGDAVALTAALMPEVVVLVADAGLGTLNAIRLTTAALEPVLETRDGVEVVVVLNRFDPDDRLHQLNQEWLVEHDSVRVVTSAGALVPILVG